MDMTKVGNLLTTDTLSLRRINSLSTNEIGLLIPLYNKWVNSPEVNGFLSGKHETIDETARRLQGLYVKQDSDWTFVIEETHQPIGFCGLHKVHTVQGHCELEIFLGNHISRNQGFGQKIVSCLCEFGFTQLELRGIVLRVINYNTQAIKCYERCGFNEVYRYPKVHERNGYFHDEIIMQRNAT